MFWELQWRVPAAGAGGADSPRQPRTRVVYYDVLAMEAGRLPKAEVELYESLPPISKGTAPGLVWAGECELLPAVRPGPVLAVLRQWGCRCFRPCQAIEQIPAFWDVAGGSEPDDKGPSGRFALRCESAQQLMSPCAKRPRPLSF